MTASFIAVAILDGWLDGSLTSSTADDKPVQATLLCVLIAALLVPAHLELSHLAAAKGLETFTSVSLPASLLLATNWFWPQFRQIPQSTYVVFVLALSVLGVLLIQYLRRNSSGVLANSGASYFSIGYLGLLSSFVLGIRIDFGLKPLLLFIFAVKSADIGAYATGSLFGKHRLSLKISPGKTWEGMAGAWGFAVLVSVAFAVRFDIMSWWLAVVFGLCFAFLGQMGDLAESMIKRDAGVKDSGSKVPGFGGILDIIDSPIAAAPFAYLFFGAVGSH